MIESMLVQRLAHDADPRLDRYYPKLVQGLVKAKRMSRKMWDEHDTRLNKEGTVCTATGWLPVQYAKGDDNTNIPGRNGEGGLGVG